MSAKTSHIAGFDAYRSMFMCAFDVSDLLRRLQHDTRAVLKRPPTHAGSTSFLRSILYDIRRRAEPSIGCQSSSRSELSSQPWRLSQFYGHFGLLVWQKILGIHASIHL